MSISLHPAVMSTLADHYYYHDGWHPWPFFWIFPVLFWLGVIAVLFLWRRSGRRDHGVGALRSAFARGEISEEDYLTRLEVLRRSRPRFWQ